MSTSQQLAAFNYAVPGPLVWNPVRSTSFNAVAGNAYPVNTTSAAITVTLPASPSAGNIVQITDYAGAFGTNACTVNPNGGKINGGTSNVNLSINRESIAIVYIDSTQGWITSFVSVTNLAAPYTASYLIEAGGGAGGNGGTGVNGGGGGAGGLLSGTSTLTPGTIYSFVVGAGGAVVAGNPSSGGAGSNSTALALTSIGGGYGTGIASTAGGSGGSGGGGTGGGASGAGGSGTSGQGYAGGSGAGGSPYNGGGGGGTGAASVNGSGIGATGTSNSITGSATFYGGGGGGGGASGAGGAGGGGAGGASAGAGTAGTVNTGGGGGGASGVASAGAGGSGVVILSVPTANYTGTITGSPTVTTSGSSTIIKFTASGSYTA